MTLKRFFLTPLVGSLLAVASIHASAEETDKVALAQETKKEALFAHQASDLEPDPAVAWGQLSNGVRYVILPHDEPPGRLSLRLLVETGSLMEEDDQRGLAHFLEHMAFNGTRHFEAEEMVEYFQRLGMAFGADTNAHTWWRETVYKLELPQINDSLLDDSFKLLRDYADGMLLLENEIESERGVILAEKRARETIEYRIFRDELLYNLPHSLIPNRLAIGDEQVIQTAPKERFEAFYRDWYTPDRFVILAVGETTPEALELYLEKYFGDLPENTERRDNPDLGKLLERGLEAKVYREPEASTASVSITALRPYIDQGDTVAVRTQEMARRVANAILNRRLTILAKEENAPFTSGTAYAFDWLDFVDYAGIDLRCQPQNWQAALTVAEQEVRRALEYGFTEAELREVKARMLNNYTQAVEQAKSRKSRDLADSLVRSVSDSFVFTSPEQELELATKVLEELTADAALEAFRKVWASPTILLYVSGNLPEGTTDALVMETYKTSKSIDVAPLEEHELSDFAYTEFGQTGYVTKETVIEELDITQLVLSNNVYVNLKKTQFEHNVIRIMVRFGAGDLSLPKDKPGLSILTSAVLIPGGLEAHSTDELDRLFAGKSVGVDFGVEPDSFVLSGSTNPADLEAQMQLMAAFILEPGFRDEALRQFRKAIPQIYLQLEHTPEGVMRDEVAAFLASGDHRFGFPEKEELMERNLDEVRDWLSEPLAKSRLELSIVGDFKQDDLLPILLRTFGALPLRDAKKPRYEEARHLRFPNKTEIQVYDYSTNIPKALGIVAWPTEDIWDISRTRRLGLLSDILSDRLRIRIREELGEAYSPYAYNRSSDTYKDYGYLAAINSLSPESVEKVTELTKEIGEDLAQHGTTEDELERMMNPLLKQIEEWRRNNRYWLGSVLASAQEYPARLEWAQSMEDDLRSITVDEINQLAAEYLKPERAVMIAIKPQLDEVAAEPTPEPATVE